MPRAIVAVGSATVVLLASFAGLTEEPRPPMEIALSIVGGKRWTGQYHAKGTPRACGKIQTIGPSLWNFSFPDEGTFDVTDLVLTLPVTEDGKPSDKFNLAVSLARAGQPIQPQFFVDGEDPRSGKGTVVVKQDGKSVQVHLTGEKAEKTHEKFELTLTCTELGK